MAYKEYEMIELDNEVENSFTMLDLFTVSKM